MSKNIIYNELVRRGYSVDVGVVEVDKIVSGKRNVSQYEIDFVVNIGNDKVYIQSALNIDTADKKQQETFSLRNTETSSKRLWFLTATRKLGPMKTV